MAAELGMRPGQDSVPGKVAGAGGLLNKGSLANKAQEP